MENVRDTSLWGGSKSITLLSGFRASPARSSDNSRVKVKNSNPEIGTNNIYKFSSNEQKTLCEYVTKTNGTLLYRAIIALYSEIHTKYTDKTQCF
jgi:hypothetical protein